MHTWFYMVCRRACRFGVILPFFFCFLFFFLFFFFQFLYVFDLVFSGSITSQFSPGHFETMHVVVLWSVDMHVVLGLSSDYFLSSFTTFAA